MMFLLNSANHCISVGILWKHNDSLWYWHQNIQGEQGQWPDCWRPGSLRRQAISNHDTRDELVFALHILTYQGLQLPMPSSCWVMIKKIIHLHVAYIWIATAKVNNNLGGFHIALIGRETKKWFPMIFPETIHTMCQITPNLRIT